MQTGRATLIVVSTLVLSPIGSAAPAEGPKADRDPEPVPAVIEPWMHPEIPAAVRGKLATAFKSAVARLHDSATCRQLFEPFDVDGTEVLAKSFYYATSVREEQRHCVGSSAFTSVGGRVTRVCRGFRRLPERRAAVVLIHEALHHAGMSERPLDPQALRSGEINELVSKSCSL